LVTFLDEMHDASVQMSKSTQGLIYLRYVLEKVREAVVRNGELTQEMCEWVLKRFVDRPNALTRGLLGYRERFLTANASAFAKASAAAQCAMADESADEKTDSDGLSPEELRDNHQRAVLSYIDLELETYAELAEQREEREEKEETAQQAANVLPAAEVLEKIMRYEGSLERQLYRAMHQLERLQRRRGGESVPPPVTVEVVRR
jgi:hypothetical protein